MVEVTTVAILHLCLKRSFLVFFCHHENKPGLASLEFKGFLQLRCCFEMEYAWQWGCLKVRSQNKVAEKLSYLGLFGQHEGS